MRLLTSKRREGKDLKAVRTRRDNRTRATPRNLMLREDAAPTETAAIPSNDDTDGASSRRLAQLKATPARPKRPLSVR